MTLETEREACLVAELEKLRRQLGTCHRAEEAGVDAMLPLHERKSFVQRVLDASINGIFVYNVDRGKNEYINRQYTQLTGWTLEELEAMSRGDFVELFHPEDGARFLEHVAAVGQLCSSDEALEIEYRFRAKDGRWIWCLARDSIFERNPDGTLRHIVGAFLDITERKAAEERRLALERRVQQTQRLESLGILAGGIAHDFNNLLMAILGQTDMALLDIPRLSPARISLDEARMAALRAAELCQQMLAYAGKGQYLKQALGLNELVTEVTQLLRGSLSRKAKLKLNLSEHLPSVFGDVAQMRQVIVNLVVNASEAIGDSSGLIIVSTEIVAEDQDVRTEPYYGCQPGEGKYVCLEVTDTGMGMNAQTRERLFEPFFTTKFTGRGLGLSAVLGIVKAHGGALSFTSELGNGTTFRVLLPSTTDYVEPRDWTEEREGASRFRGKTVLLVDDEEAVRKVCLGLLRSLGCELMVAGSGEEALALYEQHGPMIDLVLLDLTMPDMDGEETLERLRVVDPNVRVVLSSGYGKSDLMVRFSGRDLAGILQKPFTLKELSDLFTQLF